MKTSNVKEGNVKRLAFRIKEYFTGGISRSNQNPLLIYFAIISVLELLAYCRQGIFSIIASRIWLLTGLFCLAAFLYHAVSTVVNDFKQKNYVIIIGFSVLLVIFFSYIGNLGYADINADAAQQVAAGLNSFSAADWNYTGVAFLGYANRQYIVAALPALLLGRTVFSLHFGFAYPFLIGLTMLFLEFRNWLKEKGQNECYAFLPVYAFLAFPFITEYFLNFEQAITPVALTMIGIALFLRLYRHPDVITVISLAWVGCFFCDSYTPVIASLGLLCCFIALYILELFRKNAKDIFSKKATGNALPLIKVLIGTELNIVCFFIATLLGTRSDRLSAVREDVSLTSFALESWSEFFTDKNAVFLGLFSGIVVLYLFLSLLFQLKFYDFAISCWVLGVVLFANYMVGYTSYEKAWILQRNMIVIPVLITAIFLTFLRIMDRHQLSIRKHTLITIILFFAIIGIYNFGQKHQSFNYFRYIQPMKYMLSYTEDTLKEYDIKETEEFNVLLITDNLLQSNIYDYAKFFYPNAHTYSIKSGETIEEIDRSLPTFIFGETEVSVSAFGSDIEMRTFKNPRYHTSVTWYFVAQVD